MRVRLIIAIVLAIISLPVLVFSTMDPLEGGISLMVAIMLGVVVWLLARVPLPRLLWISLIATVAVGALTLGLAYLTLEQATGPGPETRPVLPVLVLVYVWNVGVIVVIVGAILYIARLFQRLRSPDAGR